MKCEDTSLALHGPRNVLRDCSPNQTHLPGIQLPAWMSAEKGDGFIFNAYTRLWGGVGGWLNSISTEQQYTQLKYLDVLGHSLWSNSGKGGESGSGTPASGEPAYAS